MTEQETKFVERLIDINKETLNCVGILFKVLATKKLTSEDQERIRYIVKVLDEHEAWTQQG